MKYREIEKESIAKYISKENTIKCMRIMDECRRQIGVKYKGE